MPEKNDSKTVHVLVLTGFGLNCDYETAYAFELAGAMATRVHINALISEALAGGMITAPACLRQCA